MTQTANATTFDLSQACLQLKPGLRFTVQHGRQDTWFLVEDRSKSAFFRLGVPEYTLISMLDGNTNVATAVGATCSTLGADALSEREAIQLCRWLIDCNLAHTEASLSASRLSDQRDKAQKQKALSKIDPIAIKFPLVGLDGPADRLSECLGFLVTRTFAVIWSITVFAGLLCLVLSDNSHVQLFSKDNLTWMVITWLGLKLIHETAHVLCCKKFGGYVGRGGILLLLLIPMPFVDVTSAWRFSNKYHRILTSAAGMAAEIFIGAIAAMFWAFSGPGPIQFHAGNIMVAASIHTLLFNANPLMRFDGYHILADWLDLPNLGNHGQNWIKSKFGWIFFGTPSQPLEYAGWQGNVIRIYGIAALAWRILLSVGLGIAAANMFYGIGLVLALVAATLWLGIPLSRLAKYLVKGNQLQPPNRLQFTGVCLGIILLAVLAGNWLPGPSQIAAPMVVEFDNIESVRTETSGFVSKIHISENQYVNKGETLFELSNPDLTGQKEVKQLELESLHYKIAQLQRDEKIAEMHNLQVEIESIKTQLKELDDQISGLLVVANESGTVVGDRLDTLQGLYVEAGQELVQIGDPNKKRVVAMLDQSDSKYMAEIASHPICVEVWGRSEIADGRVQRVFPRSRDSVPHFSFAAINGGPLDVVNRAEMEDGEDDSELMLIEPCVEMHVAIDDSLADQLRAGQTGKIYLQKHGDSLREYVTSQVSSWLHKQFKHTHGL